jgi:hypothetical protein
MLRKGKQRRRRSGKEAVKHHVRRCVGGANLLHVSQERGVRVRVHTPLVCDAELRCVQVTAAPRGQLSSKDLQGVAQLISSGV